MRIVQLPFTLLGLAALTGFLLTTSPASATELPSEPKVVDSIELGDDAEICIDPELEPREMNSRECTLACKSECGCSTIACVWACQVGDYPASCDAVC